jgi:GT2 family glycosyltransferase
LTDISIIIVTYNHQTETIECLQSLLTSLFYYRAQIIIVDNASRDHTVNKAEALQRQFEPQHNFLIIKNIKNEGFTKAVNQGLIKSKSRYILILNPDTNLSPDLFPPLFKVFKNNKRCAVVSPQFRNPDGSIQPSCRRFPRHRDLIFYTLALNKLFPKSRRFNYWHMGDFDFQTQLKVNQPQGAFLLTHRAALEQVGFLDEKFPMFFSDVDWCRRFINKGWEIIFLPDVKIIHHQGSSIFKHRLKMIWSSHRSFYYYFVKYYPGKKWTVINLATGILLIFLALMRSLFYLLTNNSKTG